MKLSQFPLKAMSGVLAIIFLCIASAVRAQEPGADSAPLFRENAAFRVGVERIKLPGNETMGMLGVNYLIELTPTLYFGPAVYGAVTGQRGGFYTAGGELAWGHEIAGDLMFVGGAYVGGGGGGASLVGGGLMVRPHADLMWRFDGYRVGLSASSVRFPNGHIRSNQVGLIVDFGTSFLHTNFGNMGQNWSVTERTGVGFDRALMFAGAYHPRSGSTNLSKVPLQKPIGYVGARMEQLVTPNLFWGVEGAGAVSGGVPGYAEFLGTVGAEMPIWGERAKIGARLALGMGGGGSIDVGGGMLVKTGVYAAVSLSRNVHASLEGGVAASPNGNFRASYGTLALHWDLDHPHESGSSSRIVGNEWVAGTQHYFKAARRDGSKSDMNSVTIKLNRFISDSFYLTGQAHSAYSGQAGGYSAGLIGAGYRTPKRFGMQAGAELLAGAGAGGGVDSSGGAVMQPMAYLSLDITKSISARLSAGRIKSLRGGLNSNVAEVGLSYSFGAGSRN